MLFKSFEIFFQLRPCLQHLDLDVIETTILIDGEKLEKKN